MKWNQLTNEDTQILYFLNQARYATTNQLARLFFADSDLKPLFVGLILLRKVLNKLA